MTAPATWLDRFFIARSQLAANFTIPAVNATQNATLIENGWLIQGQSVFMQGAGSFSVTSINANGTDVVLTNTGATGNSAPGTVIQTGAPVGIAGPPGPQGTVPNEISTGWTDILTDSPTQIFTTANAPASPLLPNEQADLDALIDVMQIGSNTGMPIRRFCQVVNNNGVLQDIITSTATNFDYDSSQPTPPANTPAALTGTTAQIVSSGSNLVVQVTRPAGVAIRARATVSLSRQTRPQGPYVLSVSPTFGSTTGGTTVTIAGESLTGATSVSLDGVLATIVSQTDTSITVTSGAGSAGTGNVVVSCTAGLGTLVNGWTYTTGVIPSISSVVPNTARGEGATGWNVVITGANFTGALGLTLNGVSYSSGSGDFVIVNDNKITIANAKATPSGSWGPGDLIITSRTSNTNAAGNKLWAALPNGLWTWHRSDLQLFASGSLTTSSWLDFGNSGTNAAYNLAASYPYTASDSALNGVPSVGQQNGVANPIFPRGNSNSFTGTALTFGAVGIRNITNAGTIGLISVFDNAASDDRNNSGSIVVIDNMPTTSTLSLCRQGATGTSATGTAPSVSTAFVASIRDTSAVATLRLNGADIATCATTGAHYNVVEYTLGSRYAGGQTGPEGASRWAELWGFDHSLSGAEIAVMNAYTTWRYNLSF